VINKLTMQLAGGIVVLMLITGLSLYAKAAVAERNLARANYETALESNRKMVAALATERAERATLEQLFQTRLDDQRRIAEEAAQTIRKQNAEIAEIRRNYEDVDVYLAVPVPAPLVEWLRAQTADNSRD